MKLIFVLTIVLIQVFFIDLFKVAKVVGALRIYAFMYYEVFALLLLLKGTGAVRALKMKL